jgi:hypothetical protein
MMGSSRLATEGDNKKSKSDKIHLHSSSLTEHIKTMAGKKSWSHLGGGGDHTILSLRKKSLNPELSRALWRILWFSHRAQLKDDLVRFKQNRLAINLRAPCPLTTFPRVL